MTCECIHKVNEALVESDSNTIIETNWLGPERALVRTVKRLALRRGKPKIMEAAYCPFCGEKYEARDAK